ncbi:SusD/RagB family nutrient-binding outer membrane lipoprotein [Mucilaginibacter sp. SMC90]|uniref:SusD/RagB family nutrient-binding outer membrane lipoprotein n=1 Tax=Mucilaginibacter sp. SMC90 TaxID=2929803 RepID=UPI001FB41F84|nr:SusD/RagB family nutrient-binding outer membrane lipoprotein [Mucilaginibacter sp. SMC90]UOE46639.1 SusD/RagB family nutrient-binding outer membrane lipoprotein [Mucilaginibacter sp. SMC90]
MKKRLIYSGFCLAATLFTTGCTKDFTKINTDPNATTADQFNPNFLLAQAQLNYSQTGYSQLLFQSMWTQSLASTFSYYGNGDKYQQSGSFNDYIGRVYSEGYGAETYAQEMKNLTDGKAGYENLNKIATIMKVLIIQRVTDTYGDVPYSEAGMAKQGIFFPKFDKQQAIYTSMLNDLDAALTGLDAAKDKPTSDLFYGGDIAQWKRFGYSLMVRLAMRLTKVDAATAQKYVEKAYAAGTMTSTDDNAKVKTNNANGYSNAIVNALLTVDDFREVRWSNTLISFMKSTTDPRVSAIAEIASGNGKAANETETVAGDNTYSKQIGLPNGYDLNGGSTDVSKAPGYPGATPANPAVDKDAAAPLGKYSRPRLQVYYTATATINPVDKSTINMLLTYGETELLLAEAATRGWNTGTAASHYAKALAADMKSIAQINAAAAISDADITTYVAAHPLGASPLEQINNEYWVETSTLFMFNENWTNWRRSGFPALTAIKYPSQFDTEIPRRVIYPITLQSTNPQGLASGVASLSGGDKFSSRVWWDK